MDAKIAKCAEPVAQKKVSKKPALTEEMHRLLRLDMSLARQLFVGVAWIWVIRVASLRRLFSIIKHSELRLKDLKAERK